jgi:hypothetical protein
MNGNYAGRCGSCRFFARLEKNGKVHQSGHCEVGKNISRRAIEPARSIIRRKVWSGVNWQRKK